jgi:hypothetical protein
LALLAAATFLRRLIWRLKGQRYTYLTSLEGGEAVALVDGARQRSFEEISAKPPAQPTSCSRKISERLLELAEIKGLIITI